MRFGLLPEPAGSKFGSNLRLPFALSASGEGQQANRGARQGNVRARLLR